MKKMQLNSKELKGFRNTLALWHTADFKLADALCKKQRNVKAIRTMIESDNEILEKVRNGESTLKTESELLAEIESFNKKIEEENAIIKALHSEIDADIKNAYALITSELMIAISNYLSDIHNDENEELLLTELAKWFKSNGAKDATNDNVRPYIRALGQASASARKKAMNKKHNVTPSNNTLKKIFLGAICDEPSMLKELPLYKWETIIEKKTSNK